MKHALTLFILVASVPVFSFAQTSIQCPTVTRPLSVGTYHKEVVALKKYLSGAGFLAGVSNTTYFGPSTATAVKKFQKSRGLEQTGSTGPKTRAALKSCNIVISPPVGTVTKPSVPSKTPPPIIAPPSNNVFGGGGGGGSSSKNYTSCTFNNQSITHGASITAYQISSAAFGQSCRSEVRTCNDGTLSGSYVYTSCSVQGATSCSVAGTTISHGESKTLYLSSNVPYGQTCQSESRTCTNGALSGSYTNLSCSVSQPASCALDGVTVAHGASQTFYSSRTAASCSAVSQSRSCTNGTMSGGTNYQYASCTAQEAAAPTATFTVNGKSEVTVNVGDTLTYAYSSTGGASAKTTFTQDSDSCGVTGTGPFNWAAGKGDTLTGSFTTGVVLCHASHTYVITYKVTAANGKTASATVTVHVNAPPTLTAPMGLKYSCAPAGNKVTVFWDPVRGADSYSVRIQDTTTWEYKGFYDWWTKGTSYATDITPNTNYKWWIHADQYPTHGPYTLGTEFSCKDKTGTGLTAPTNLKYSCSADGTQVTLTWDAPTGVTNYAVRVQDKNNWSYKISDDHYVGGPTYYAQISPNTPYKWWVHANNSMTEYGPYTEGVDFMCSVASAPADPTATITANGKTEVTVNVGDTVQYVWNSTNAVQAEATFTQDSPSCGTTGNGPFPWNLAGTSLSGAAPDKIYDCHAGHTYTVTYKVTSASGKTATATMTVRVNNSGASNLTAPTNLQYSCNAAGDKVTVSWSPVTGADGYSVRIQDTSVWNYAGFYDWWTGGTSYTADITPNQNYRWWIHSDKYPSHGAYTLGAEFQCKAPVATSIACVVKASDISTDTNYTTQSTKFTNLCASYNATQIGNFDMDKWMDTSVTNVSSCAASVNARIDYWIFARDTTSGVVSPVRFKSVNPGETSLAHIDLSVAEFRNKNIQFVFLAEQDPAAKTCASLKVNSMNVANRTQLFPPGASKQAALKSKFQSLLSVRPGFSNVWGWYEWRRVPPMAKLDSDLNVPFFRTFLTIPISNLQGCNANDRADQYDYRYCFAWSDELVRVDNAMEELYYHNVPVIANVHGLNFTDGFIKNETSNYQNPRAFTAKFTHPDTHLWGWNPDGYRSIDNLMGWDTRTYLSSAYQYYRYDPVDTGLLYGVQEKVLDRYRAAIVAVEPGGEQNWHPPQIRSDANNDTGREQLLKESVDYFTHFCTYGKAMNAFCIMTSMADGLVTDNARTGEKGAKDMLTLYKDVVAQADYANFHIYMGWVTPSIEQMKTFIDDAVSRYGTLLGGKKIIMTEFGYDQPSQTTSQPNLISSMRSFAATRADKIAGMGYWMDIGNTWQRVSADNATKSYYHSAAMVPFDPTGAQCGQSDVWCPLVNTSQICNTAAYTCPDWSTTGQAWAYQTNWTFYNQFK